jgi:hypothetical protein
MSHERQGISRSNLIGIGPTQLVETRSFAQHGCDIITACSLINPRSYNGDTFSMGSETAKGS